MRWSEIGLVLLAVSAISGLFLVVSTQRQPVPRTTEETQHVTGPLEQLEADLASVIYGPGFREVPAAPPDTIVRSMDLVDSVSIHQANLLISRALERRGFSHRSEEHTSELQSQQ